EPARSMQGPPPQHPANGPPIAGRGDFFVPFPAGWVTIFLNLPACVGDRRTYLGPPDVSSSRRASMKPSWNVRRGCDDLRRTVRPDRRSFLKAGVLGAAGLGLADLLRADAEGTKPTPGGRQPSVIILWMRGGPSHIDMWDPKPDAPAEYRGEFRTIPTRVPGILTTELLPLSARMQEKFSIIRSLNHHDAGHSTG